MRKIDLYYLDESGFCGIPCVLYKWQDIGEYLSIDSRQTQRLNVLEIRNRQNTLHAYVSEQTINFDAIIACIDNFFAVMERSTFIVVDRAYIHTSNAIFDRIEG
jgi:DDE superfamily endonuclease